MINVKKYSRSDCVMNERIIDYLEVLKCGNSVSVETYLSNDDKQAILSWYRKYIHVHDNIDFEKVIDLLYVLYVRENLEFYPVNEFQQLILSLAQTHGFDKNDFWSLYSDFRILVFGDNV